MKIPTESRPASIQPPMTAMIDVVFLLLVFFVWTASIDRPEYDLHGGMAVLQTAAPQNRTRNETPVLIDELVIRIQWISGQPIYLLNQQEIVNLADLSRRLVSIAASGARPPVIVHPDAEVPLAIAVEVYDRAILAGLNEVLFAAPK